MCKYCAHLFLAFHALKMASDLINTGNLPTTNKTVGIAPTCPNKVQDSRLPRFVFRSRNWRNWICYVSSEVVYQTDFKSSNAVGEINDLTLKELRVLPVFSTRDLKLQWKYYIICLPIVSSDRNKYNFKPSSVKMRP